MAVKAVAMIKDFGFDGSEAQLRLYLDIQSVENDSVAGVELSGLDPSVADLTLNGQVAEFVKTYCEEEWGITFGLLDTVRVIFKVNSLL